MASVTVPLPSKRPLVDLLEAAEAMEMGRTTAYELVRKNEFPVEVVRVGGRLKVRTADLRKFLRL